MVTAIVLIQAERGQVEPTAEALLELPEVAEVYSVAGEYDLVALVRVREYDQMAHVVPGKLARVGGIQRTMTLMAFQAYSRHDVERMWSVGLDEEAAARRRAEGQA
jgi:DNA-binding Lrp family transcriptional regulator